MVEQKLFLSILLPITCVTEASSSKSSDSLGEICRSSLMYVFIVFLPQCIYIFLKIFVDNKSFTIEKKFQEPGKNYQAGKSFLNVITFFKRRKVSQRLESFLNVRKFL